MANLDTENKRRSVTGILNIYTIPPVPDGTIAALDRQQATYLYAGIAAAGLAAVTSNNLLSLITYQQPFNTPIPAPTGAAMTQGDKQHLIWQYSNIDWGAPAAGFFRNRGLLLGVYRRELVN